MEEPRYSVQQLLDRIQQEYDALQALLKPLSDEQLAAPGPSGWAIKDHLTHLAVWEAYAASLLLRSKLPEAAPIWEGSQRDLSEDEENDLIYRSSAHLTAEEARIKLERLHRKVVETIQKLSDEDLYKPFSAYVPEAERQEPIIDWIVGNTFGHYEEHRGYLQSEFGLGG